MTHLTKAPLPRFSLKILIDMNLTPMWVFIFHDNGYYAVHWSSIGKPTASHHEIMEYAQQKEFVSFRRTGECYYGYECYAPRLSIICPCHLERNPDSVVPVGVESKECLRLPAELFLIGWKDPFRALF